jgi:DNA-binding Xre family transcriptional regulator
MTGKRITKIQEIANGKGWKFEDIAKRWGISERQMSRVASAGKQRDIDAINGMPDKK